MPTYKKYETDSPTVQSNPLCFTYKNWKGEIGLRTVIPVGTWYGHTDYHTEDQWMLKAFDIDKQAHRDFAMKDIISW